MINIYNKDCLEALKEMQDNQFDLAIVDPPYGIDMGNKINSVLINEDATSTGELQNFIIEIDTLEIVQTFNTTWTNNAIGKLRRWLNDITK